jgi:hypothetical protein
MSDVATFFRHREKDSGETYRLQFETGKSAHRVSVYARKPLQSSTLRSLQVKDRDGLEVALRALRKDIAGQGGGGWLVAATDEGSSRRLSVAGIPASGFEPASRFFMLSPGRPTSMYDTGDKTLKVPLGSHAIVPVDEEATAKLGEFLSYLSWLPNDMESVVLNAIRRPSLDARLDRVETELFGRTAAQELRGPWTAQVAQALRSNVVRVAAVVLIVMMLGVAGYSMRDKWTWRLNSTATVEPAEPPAPQPTVTTPTDTGSKPPTATEQAVVDEAKALIRQLRAQKSTADIKYMWEGHFQAIGSSAEPTEGDIRRLLSHYEENKSKPEETAFLWGLIKLQAYQRKPTRTDKRFLLDMEQQTPTREVLSDVQIATPASGDPGAKGAHDFIAALACRLDENKPPSPTLRKPKSMEPLNLGGRCEEYTPAHLIAGFKTLQTFVGGL